MSPKPSEHPRPARRRQVAGPRGSSLPRLRYRAPDVTLPEFTQASGGHDRSLLRPPAPDPDTTNARHASLQTPLSHRPPEPRLRPQPAANRARPPPTRTASHTRPTRTSPAPRRRLPPEPEHGTCACARMRETRDAPTSTVFFKAVRRMRSERPGRRRGWCCQPRLRRACAVAGRGRFFPPFFFRIGREGSIRVTKWRP